MQTENIRNTFLSLINTFPNLDISITQSEGTQLNVCDENGLSFSLALNILEESELQVREAIFVIKEKLRIFDA